MAGISFFHIKKICDPKALCGVYNHNMRTRKVINANEAQRDDNELLYSSIGDKTYYQAFYERHKELQNMYPEKKVLRSNGVAAFEIVTSMPRSDLDHVNLDEWKKDQVEWLRKTFNRDSEKHGENVLSIVFHGDEVGSVHCHAVVLPVNGNGKFSRQDFFNSKSDLSALQDDYARMMQRHGLNRGLKRSVAKHKDIARFYTELNQNLCTDDVPVLQEGESIEDYNHRIKTFFEDYSLGKMKEKYKLEDEVVRQKTLNRQKEDELEKLRDKLHCLENLVSFYSRDGTFNIDSFLRFLENAKKLELFIQNANSVDYREQRQQLFDLYNEAVEWSERMLNPMLYKPDLDTSVLQEIDKDLEEILPYRCHYRRKHKEPPITGGSFNGLLEK